MQAPEQVQAWSDEDETESLRQPWRAVWPRAAIVLTGSVALASAAGAAAWLYLSPADVPPAKPKPTAAAPSTPVAVPAPPRPAPPPPVTVTAQPPTPAPVLSDDDHRLLHNLRSADAYEADNPALVVEHAHRYCALVQQGFSGYQAWQTVVSESHNEVGMHSTIPRPLLGAARTPTEMAWNILTAEASTVYPNCTD